MARPTDKICMCMCLSFMSVCIVVVVIVCTTHFSGQGCSRTVFKKAAVAADSETCSKIGRPVGQVVIYVNPHEHPTFYSPELDILKSGGSAVDGAIAALLCTSVINPQSMGIGGGSIFTVFEKNGKVKIINSRETVPRVFKANLLSECPKTQQLIEGSQWIGVPGEIRGYEEAHRQYGQLPWHKLFQPTIKLARDGIPIQHILSRFLDVLKKNPALPLRQLFLNKDGNLMKEGDIIKFERLAETLQIISEDGADAFYTGRIAKDLIDDIKDAGGTLSLEDLSSFRASWSEAWTVPLGEYQMHFPPPPAGGAILSFILNVMKGYNLSPVSLKGEQKTLMFQHYVEACKFANGLKKFVRDPSFDTDMEAFRITQADFSDRVRAMMSSNTTHDPQYYNVTPSLENLGTTHVSVLAEDGMAVSVTSTINHIFGSRVFSPKTGVILNNELSDFCGRVEQLHPGEQPPSSMSPLILTSKSKDHTLVIGGSGGNMITTGMALTIMNYLWLGKSLEDSISAPVVYVDAKNALKFEPKFDQSVIEALKELGHTVEVPKIFYNVINAVSKQAGCIDAVSDVRKMGKAAGY